MFNIGETVQFILDNRLQVGAVQHVQGGVVWVKVMGHRQLVSVPVQYVAFAIDTDEYNEAFPERDYDSEAEYAEYMARFTH